MGPNVLTYLSSNQGLNIVQPECFDLFFKYSIVYNKEGLRIGAKKANIKGILLQNLEIVDGSTMLKESTLLLSFTSGNCLFANVYRRL